MINLALTSRQKLGLRVLALASASIVFASGSRFACAQTPAPAAAPADTARPVALKLFADSRMLIRDRISVEVVGSGPDVVMIPGLASSRETWRRTAERLRSRYRVHLVQIAGFAGEPARANATGPVFDPVLADLDAYMAGLPRPPIVFGHSLGGTLALAEAERHPDHVRKVLIVDSLPFYGVLMGGPAATVDTIRPIAQAMAANMKGSMPPAAARAMAAQMVTAPADVDRVVAWMGASDPRVIGVAMTDDMMTDLRPGLASVRTPITVLYETPIKAAIEEGYAALNPKTLVEAPNSKHFIMYDQPTRFDAEVDAFLRG